MYNFNGCRTHIDNVVDQKEKKQSAGHGGIDSRHIKNNFIPDVIWSVIVTIFFRGYSFSIISLGLISLLPLTFDESNETVFA
jgi:hypothetical protein